MDIRVLRYFLTIAGVGSITRAAEMLHITQPTLSRQMMDLGATLPVRGKRQVTLTSAGLLFQQRAKEIMLLDKTERDLLNQKTLMGGVVSVGCVETNASVFLADTFLQFAADYPHGRYALYSADGNDIRERIDAGLVDVGILPEPVETAKSAMYAGHILFIHIRLRRLPLLRLHSKATSLLRLALTFLPAT